MCQSCELVFVPTSYFVETDEELAHYEKHENSPEDAGYRSFLSALFTPIQTYINKGEKGLDYGCGPGPTLSIMFQEMGFEMDIYDPYFFPSETLEKHYSFVTCTEVVEHFYNPIIEFEKLFSLLKPNGVLGLMTQLITEKVNFNSWYYIRDKTHVHFYTKETFKWLAKKYNKSVSFYGENAIVFY